MDMRKGEINMHEDSAYQRLLSPLSLLSAASAQRQSFVEFLRRKAAEVQRAAHSSLG